MYRLATIHLVTDKHTDDRIIQIADHTACSSMIG